MLFKKNFHYNTYQRDENGVFKILVAVNKYEDIYSDWDPSPFRRRDIEGDFIEYIWDSAIDIPLNENIKIIFLIKGYLRNDKKEMQLLKAVNNYFKYLLHKSERQYFEEKKKSFKYFIIGIVLALIAYSGVFKEVALWVKIFEEGIIIGSWVFFWEAFYNIFMESAKLREDQKIIKRFLKTEYIFESME
ncbi:hypothetical protein [Oceanivirga salmonicida]|uniref:hypothetical protein n=1 Tax=Oceanivirga salmonicida TaxID=1769291 RepID=UPI000832D663|nr:hypothetical protein [Oceanivirga salmonicida]